MSEFICPEPGCDFHIGIAGDLVTDEDFEAQDYYDQEIKVHIQRHEEERRRTEIENRGAWEHCFSRVRLGPGVCVREHATPIIRRFGFPRVAEECANKCHDVLLNRLKQVQNSLRFENSGYVNRLYASGFEFHLHVVLSSSAGDLGGGHYCTRLTHHVVGDEIGDERAGSVSNPKFAGDATSRVGETAMLVEVAQVSKGLEREVVPVTFGFEGVDLRSFEVCQELWGDHFAQVVGISSKVGRGVRNGERKIFERRVGSTNFVDASDVFTDDVVKGGSIAVDSVTDHERPVSVRKCGFRDSPLSQISALLSGISFEVDARSCRVKFVEGFNRFYESCAVVIAPQELAGSAKCRSTVILDQQVSLSVDGAPVGAGVGTSESTERDQTPVVPEMKEHPAVAAAGCDETKTNR